MTWSANCCVSNCNRKQLDGFAWAQASSVNWYEVEEQQLAWTCPAVVDCCFVPRVSVSFLRVTGWTLFPLSRYDVSSRNGSRLQGQLVSLNHSYLLLTIEPLPVILAQWGRFQFFLCITTVFVDTRLWKTKHPRKRLQNFHQSYVLLTDRIEIHQSQPLAWPSDLLYVMLAGCDWWISILYVVNT